MAMEESGRGTLETQPGGLLHVHWSTYHVVSSCLTSTGIEQSVRPTILDLYITSLVTLEI